MTEAVAIAILVAALLTAFLFGLHVGRPAVIPAMIVGVVSGLIGDTIVFEGMGGGLCGHPILCLMAALIGLFFRSLREEEPAKERREG